MKHLFILLTALCLIMVLVVPSVLTGCGGTATPTTATKPAPAPVPAPAPAPSSAAPAPAPAPVPAATATFELKFTDQYAPQMTDAIRGELLGKMITESTGGKIKFTYFHAESAGKVADFLNLLNGNVVDVANLTPGNYANQFPMVTGLELPLLGFPDRAVRINATWELYDKGFFKKEFTNYKVLAFNSTPGMNLYIKKKVLTVADLKGVKIRASAAADRTFLEKLGATPVAMSGTEVYMALDRGTIDGAYTSYENFLQQKFYEVCKNTVWNHWNYGCMLIVMSKAAWDKLPADVQQSVEKASANFKNEFIKSNQQADIEAVDALKKQGMDVVTFTADEVAKLTAAATPIKTDWVAAREKDGLPGKSMMEALDAFLAKK